MGVKLRLRPSRGLKQNNIKVTWENNMKTWIQLHWRLKGSWNVGWACIITGDTFLHICQIVTPARSQLL